VFRGDGRWSNTETLKKIKNIIIVNPKIPSAQRKSRDAENAENAPEAEKSRFLLSVLCVSALPLR
jgi:hypothetical protein